MDNSILDRFERQLDALLQKYKQLKQDHSLLRAKQRTILGEYNLLQAKHKSAVDSIEKMVNRLETIKEEDVRTTE